MTPNRRELFPPSPLGGEGLGVRGRASDADDGFPSPPALLPSGEREVRTGRPTTPGTGPESPALAGFRVPAYELKFLLTEAQAGEVEAMLRDHLALDPHADPTLGSAYRVTSVYFDTPRFDVYHRAAGHRTHKFRLRRYGSDPAVYLERKSKRAGRVWKRRTAVPLAGLDGLSGTADDWPGAWFARQLTARGLRPVCRVTYERTAFVGAGPDGPVRLTMDRFARGLASPTAGRVEPFDGGLPLLDRGVIVEFKFLAAMPALFKEVVAALRLAPSGVSKYRRCAAAAGLTAGGAGDA